ncbi:hypothetical protein K461DRAFT_270299 [Myriangium duriaei CBS 260.36]|uniref:Uncharacterized protein n=1 Tax=Myriangium duriaei CBS 260.36 TaxID=1168546 RepID=A0A9P4IWA4_9PEZI|nr:hypothetical protein K461DRAFT_270299 [Myriangium duriaei CBS 260.36]
MLWHNYSKEIEHYNTKFPVLWVDDKWEEDSESQDIEQGSEALKEEEDIEAEDKMEEMRHQCIVWPVTEFFEVLRQQFEQQNVVSLSPLYVKHMDENDGVICATRDIFLQHEWPDLSRYDKAQCMDAVRRILEQDFFVEASAEIASFDY